MTTRTRKARKTPLQRTGTTRKAIVDRIVSTVNSATTEHVSRGLAWYGDALDTAITVAEFANVPIENGAAIVAALSPQLGWQPNKEAAIQLATDGTKKNGVLTESYERALRVSGVSDPVAALNRSGGAKKIESFARNILGDTHAVTIDVWAIRVALGPTPRGGTHDNILRRVGVYEYVADCYREAAALLGMAPCQAQAIAWCAIRGSAD